MNAGPRSRAHLVERAVEAMGGQTLPPPPAPLAPPPAPTPAGGFAPPPPPGPPHGGLGGSMGGGMGGGAPPPPAQTTIEPISVETLGAAGLVVAPCGTVRSRLSEEIAVVQHAVLRTLKATRATDGRCPRIVMVTSARPGEGKTFMSLNLAASLANSGTRPVVLVDVDGKVGSISALLGHAETPGIRILAAETTRAPVSLLVPTAVKRLSLLTYGPLPPSMPGIPPGQLVTAALLRLAAALPDHLIVLDTPPCLSTSDPGALAPIAGQVLMVVELVLNRAVLTANDTFGAYGGYGAYAAYPGA